jgi:hypothetical protein
VLVKPFVFRANDGCRERRRNFRQPDPIKASAFWINPDFVKDMTMTIQQHRF